MRLAIVTPTLNEEQGLRSHLVHALAIADLVVVADGGSRDATVAVARSLGACVVESPPGRGPQLNRGAQAALAWGADALLFLHADTRLPGTARQQIEQSLASGAVGGGFLIRFSGERLLLRFGSRLVNLRTRRLHVPLGDQAQFCTAGAFASVGGFPEWPILEDLELLRRLRKHGRLRVVPEPVETDARRFVQRGVVRTVATNWLIWALYLLGFSPHRLAGLYRQVR